MQIRPHRIINRKKTKEIKVGKVSVGGNSPITVQSMTNTLTTDVKNTINQIKELEDAGADIVRVSCPDENSTKSLKEIIKNVGVPIVADIHFHYKRAIEAAQMGASCLRINPGNIGSNQRVLEVVKAAKDNNCSIRIGVNAGSLDKSLLEKYKEPCPEALVESAKNNIKLLEDNDFFNFKISVKSSDIFLTVKAYKKLSEICDYPLHLGVTEAGSLFTGSIKSSIGIGQLLMEGIGDTIRVSLSSDPVDEVKAGTKRVTYGLGIGYPQENKPRYESDDTELMIGASNGSRITLTGQETSPSQIKGGMQMRKATIVDIKGKENTIVKDPYDKEHLLPEKPTSKINTSLHSIRDIKAIEIK